MDYREPSRVELAVRFARHNALLARFLQGLLASRVKAARISIWPSPGWPCAVDDESLILDLECQDGISRSIRFGQENNHSELVEAREVDTMAGYLLSDLQNRLKVWQSDEMWTGDVVITHEAFEVAASDDIGWVLGRLITAFEIVCVGAEWWPLGLVIHFGEEHLVISTGGGIGRYGNILMTPFSAEVWSDQKGEVTRHRIEKQ